MNLEISEFGISNPYTEWQSNNPLVNSTRRNALRANLVRRAEDWRWGSLHRWQQGSAKDLLAAWPLRRLANWVQEVNVPHSEAELSALRRSVNRGCPFGEACWSDRIVARLGLESTLRFRGRPKKHNNGS